MRKKKKAVFYTFAALFIIIIVLASISTRETYRHREKSNAISSRIRTMDNFIEDFEKDLDRALFIGGYRAMLSMNAYIRDIENYVFDFDSVFEEILVNGTANSTQMDLMVQDSQGAYITSWVDRINAEASELNINVLARINKVTVSQVSPWEVEISLNASFYISDIKGLAAWNITKIYTKRLSIMGFEDPLYTVETEDKLTNLINITTDFDFVNDVDNDTTSLINHLTNSYYINSTSAPSFLMRFLGNFSASPYGIESMVNLEDLNSQSIPILQRSVIDYIYFGNLSTSDYCNITGNPSLPSWFRIDDAHEEVYEIDRLEKLSC